MLSQLLRRVGAILLRCSTKVLMSTWGPPVKMLWISSALASKKVRIKKELGLRSSTPFSEAMTLLTQSFASLALLSILSKPSRW